MRPIPEGEEIAARRNRGERAARKKSAAGKDAKVGFALGRRGQFARERARIGPEAAVVEEADGSDLVERLDLTAELRVLDDLEIAVSQVPVETADDGPRLPGVMARAERTLGDQPCRVFVLQ